MDLLKDYENQRALLQANLNQVGTHRKLLMAQDMLLARQEKDLQMEIDRVTLAISTAAVPEVTSDTGNGEPPPN